MLTNILGTINDLMYSYLLIILLLFVGVWFTIRSKFMQIRFFPEAIRVVMQKPKNKEGMSSFAALMVSTASRVGSGNIVGVSTAICLGGYGAVFWMWVIATLGSCTAFVESTLAQIYKRRAADGSCYGGPSYYIEAAMKKRWLAVFFAACLIFTYGVGFNMLAAYNLQSTFSSYSFYNPAVTPGIIGLILGLVCLYCLLGGGKRIARIAEVLVPVMGVTYILIALIVMVMNIDVLPSAIAKIFASAFDFKSIFGGFAGSCMMFGIKRGLWSNEAGVGSAPNAAASADVLHPVSQGLVQVLSVFIDTLLICSATAFMCVCSGVEPSAELAGAPYVQQALGNNLGVFGLIFVTFAMTLFVFTTLLGNYFYIDSCLAYIVKKVPSRKFMRVVRVIGAFVIFLGSILSMDLVWNLADIMMGIMVIINVPIIFIMSGKAFKALENYTAQKKAGRTPVFYAADIGLEKETECWNNPTDSMKK